MVFNGKTHNSCRQMWSYNFSSKRNISIQLSGNTIPYKRSRKLFWVLLDCSLRYKKHINCVCQKLSKFCVLIHRGRHFHSRMCLFMFFQFTVESIIWHGLPNIRTVSKSNLENWANIRRILKGVLFRKKNDLLTNIANDNGFLTVFELYISRNIQKLLRQIRLEAPAQNFSCRSDLGITQMTRRRFKGLKSSIYSRLVAKRKSVDCSSKKVFFKKLNWFQGMDLFGKKVKILVNG